MNSRITKALEIAAQYGGTDGAHHKAWVIDQMVRALTDCRLEAKSAIDVRGGLYTFEEQGKSAEYLQFVIAYQSGADGPETYIWEEGTPP